jgi:hypothetical protein
MNAIISPLVEKRALLIICKSVRRCFSEKVRGSPKHTAVVPEKKLILDKQK